MTTLRSLLRAIGTRTLAAVLLTPVIVAGILFALTPALVTANQQASARVDLAPIIGTRTTFEVTSFVADFGSAYLGYNAANQSPTAGPYIDIDSQGNSSSVIVHFTSTSRQSADEGLRTATEQALRTVAQSRVDEAELDQKSAAGVLTQTLQQASKPIAAANGISAATQQSSQSALVSQASQNAAAANLQVATAKLSLDEVPETVESLDVSIASLSTTSQQIRVVMAGAVSALVIAILAAIAWHRRRIRDGGGAPPVGGHSRRHAIRADNSPSKRMQYSSTMAG